MQWNQRQRNSMYGLHRLINQMSTEKLTNHCYEGTIFLQKSRMCKSPNNQTSKMRQGAIKSRVLTYGLRVSTQMVIQMGLFTCIH